LKEENFATAEAPVFHSPALQQQQQQQQESLPKQPSSALSDGKAPEDGEEEEKDAGHEERSKSNHNDNDKEQESSKWSNDVRYYEREEDATKIVLPAAGLAVGFVHGSGSSSSRRPSSYRQAPGFCTICLCTYEVNDDVVWSSNAECPHVFHRDCMLSWLLKLHRGDGPLCPCCRRDFLIDPYDASAAASAPEITTPAATAVTDVERDGSAAAAAAETDTVGWGDDGTEHGDAILERSSSSSSAVEVVDEADEEMGPTAVEE
jgi:Ring finger domain